MLNHMIAHQREAQSCKLCPNLLYNCTQIIAYLIKVLVANASHQANAVFDHEELLLAFPHRVEDWSNSKIESILTLSEPLSS